MSVDDKSFKRGLGRGLDSLIPLNDDFSSDDMGKKEKLTNISVEKIKPNPLQPRQSFDDNSLAELANSIKEHGIIQPLIVTKIDSGYELIAGERRLRASKLIGLSEVPAIIRDAEKLKKLELAVIENVQRDDLNVLDEARSYKRLIDEFSLSQEDVAKKVGKSRSAVANKIRLLDLPVEIKRALNSKDITEGHARSLLGLPNHEKMLAVFKLVAKGKLSVRETEKKVNDMLRGSVLTIKKDEVDPNILQLEKNLREALGARVRLKGKRKGGSLIIDYTSSKDLERILNFFLTKK